MFRLYNTQVCVLCCVVITFETFELSKVHLYRLYLFAVELAIICLIKPGMFLSQHVLFCSLALPENYAVITM